VIRPRAYPPPFVYVTCCGTWPEHGVRARNEHHNPPPGLPYPPLARALLFFLNPCAALQHSSLPRQTHPRSHVTTWPAVHLRTITPASSTASCLRCCRARPEGNYSQDHPASSTSRSLLSSCRTLACVEAALAAATKNRDRNGHPRSTSAHIAPLSSAPRRRSVKQYLVST
jgi:hypothetical protein